MAKQDNKAAKETGILVTAAKAIGSAAGKVASLAASSSETPEAPPQKEGLYKAVYFGSGTFAITKPKRKDAKLRQSRLKGSVRGART